MGMKISTLEYLIALADSRSINEAAQKLYVAQPSLTKALQGMERELGFQLFVRTKSGIELTEAGRQILPEARQMVANYKGWLELGKGRPLRSLNIYTHVSFPNFLLPDVILKFKSIHPELRINCASDAAPDLYISQNTENPSVVIFPCAKGEAYQRCIKQQGNRPSVLFRGEYVCLVNRSASLAAKKQISLKELGEYYLVLPEIDEPQGHSSLVGFLINSITDICQDHKIIQVESVNSVIELVQKHPDAYALSYYPALYRYAGMRSKKLTHIPFADIDTKSDYCLFYSKQAYAQYPLLQEIIRAIHEQAAEFLSTCPAFPT